MRALLLLLPLLAACDDFVLLNPGSTDTSAPADGWCGVQQIFHDDCLTCHSTSGALGSLDLETDPYTALVDVPAAADGTLTLVIAGDPDNSFLVQKIEGTQASGLGGRMPAGTPLPQTSIDLIRKWITDGASDVCTGPIDTGPVGAYHPAGWADSDVHGLAAKMQDQQCISCHGADLTGDGDAVSCDSCHTEGWRTDCTFCHGDPADGTGSPPRHISGLDDGALASFIPHRAHTSANPIAVEFDCVQCHTKPTDVLTPGHIFVGDSTPGEAEANFSGGLSKAGVFTASTNTCSNLYCHGTGRGNNGQAVDTMASVTCHTCHSDMSTGGRWGTMSGEHSKHLGEGLGCHECHASTASSNTAIGDKTLHVNGAKDVVFAGSMVRTNGTCTGTCHGEPHDARSW
jgi:predicted CxxxxCH...CXXCH cytochrome family protein